EKGTFTAIDTSNPERKTTMIPMQCPACLAKWEAPDGTTAGTNLECPTCHRLVEVKEAQLPPMVLPVQEWHCPYCGTTRLPEKVSVNKNLPFFFLLGGLFLTLFTCGLFLLVLIWQLTRPNSYWRCVWCDVTLQPQDVDMLK